MRESLIGSIVPRRASRTVQKMSRMAGSTPDAGWASLFWQAFRSSRNGMALVDDQRRMMEVNGSVLQLLGYPRGRLVGRPIYEIVHDGPLFTQAEWREVLGHPHYYGVVDLVTAGGGHITVEFAAHPEIVTHRQLVLAVVLGTTRPGGHQPPRTSEVSARGVLTRREREVVHLIALGHSGPEIAEELHVSHNTVRSHITHAMNKLGARSRAQLVAIALGHGHTLA
jgi:PAS domain S-box-containing protein